MPDHNDTFDDDCGGELIDGVLYGCGVCKACRDSDDTVQPELFVEGEH